MNKFNQQSAVILNGSPRQHGNTVVLVKWLEEALQKKQWTATTHNLYSLSFKGCAHCDACMKVMDRHGCVLRDDLNGVLDDILQTDLIVIATPVYCWSTSGCMSAALDRFLSFFKHLSGGSSLIKGKKVIGAFTSGGDHFDGMDLCVNMLKQLCICGQAEYAATIAATNCTTPEELLTRNALQAQVLAHLEVL